jgi:alkyl sulfatase BDS1-like metallo-beta-lactamase superfamily hydrolase
VEAGPDGGGAAFLSNISFVQRQTSIEQAITSSDFKVEAKRAVFDELLGILDDYQFWFNTVTP